MAEVEMLDVERLLEHWVTFWNSYDLDQFDALFVAGEKATYFSSEYDGLIRGSAALRQHHAGFGFVPGGKPSGNRLWLSKSAIDWYGEVAVVTATWQFQRAGADTIQRGPVTLVIAKVAGVCRIAHAHFANAREAAIRA